MINKKRFVRLGKNIFNFIKRKPSFFYTNVILTRNCTQNCLQCVIPHQKDEKMTMRFSDFKLIIDKLENYGTQALVLSGGEPMLHPQIEECIRYAKSKNIKKIHLLTTLYGTEQMIAKTIKLIFKYGLSISCSFDAIDDKADILRGRKDVARQVKQNIAKINKMNSKLKKPITTGVNVVISQLNVYQIPEIINYMETVGWKTNLDIYRWSSDNHRETDDLKIKDIEKLKKVIEIAKKSPIVFTPDWLLDGYIDYLQDSFPKQCPYLLSPTFGSKFFIQPDGNIKICEGSVIGNLIHQEVKEIFNSRRWAKAKSKFLRCKGCWNSCYTLSAHFTNYLNVKDIKKIKNLILKKR